MPNPNNIAAIISTRTGGFDIVFDDGNGYYYLARDCYADKPLCYIKGIEAAIDRAWLNANDSRFKFTNTPWLSENQIN